jgi:hypothetical protein
MVLVEEGRNGSDICMLVVALKVMLALIYEHSTANDICTGTG